MRESKRSMVLLHVAERKTKLASPKGGAISEILSAPFRTVGESVATLALGQKARTGVMKGKRVQYSGRRQISHKQYKKLEKMRTAGEPTPTTHIDTDPTGKHKSYSTDVYRRGGAVGLAQKHPLLTAGGGIASYFGAKYLLGRKRSQQQAPPPPQASQEAWG
jgi:hypothetical protein